MQCIDRIRYLQEQLSGWRNQGQTIALVPTMGNLHAGHLTLIHGAQQNAQRTVVTIFVNPIQFVEGEDYASYPRTIADDRKRLEAAGIDVLFHPSLEEMYPTGLQHLTRVIVDGLDDVLCGKFRKGHFSGVATVVTKLFHIINPDVAVFGEKDYQQLLVIRRLVQDLHLPVRIMGMPTVREEDGLALSSRNFYLDKTERRMAPLLYKSLQHIVEEIKKGNKTYAELENNACARLAQAGFRPEYVSVRRATDLGEAGEDRDLVVLAAAWLGQARLIDNILVRR